MVRAMGHELVKWCRILRRDSMDGEDATGLLFPTLRERSANIDPTKNRNASKYITGLPAIQKYQENNRNTIRRQKTVQPVVATRVM
jgi:hypothetical protein